MSRADLYTKEFAIDAREQIRLLELLPALHSEEPVACRLHTCDHLSEADFEALSYTWGSNSKGTSITLNDVPDFGVTNNLHSALTRLRRKDCSRSLWIDALCIDQENLDERSQQVKLMGDIYQYAVRVIVWLGDATEPEHLATSPFRPIAPTTLPLPSEVEDWKMRFVNSALATTEPRWWRRTWIIQEAVLAGVLSVQIGPFELSWVELGLLREKMSAMFEITRSSVVTDELQAYIKNPQPAGSFGYHVQHYLSIDFDNGFQALETLRTHKEKWAGLSEIASVTSCSRATDLKDRAYGYYGLWSGRFAHLLDVDYRKPLSEVLADATYADMQAENNLVVLNLVRPNDRHIQNLPSWTLDFSFGNFEGDLPVYPTIVINHDEREINIGCKVEDKCSTLVTRAYIVESIKEVHALPKSLVYTIPEEDDLLSAVVSSIPTCNAYDILATHATGDLIHANHLSVRLPGPPPPHLFIETLQVSTDPISNIFLWWLSEIRKATPNPKDFSQIQTWWKDYICYQSWSESSPRPRNREAFYITQSGFVGRTLPTTQPGDIIAFLRGLDIPVVLGQEDNDRFSFKGLCWLNGGMMGELRDILQHKLAEKTIRLI